MSERRKGRPTKEPGEARDRRIVVWVNPRERARFLINAARTGLTGSDFARGMLCHDAGLSPTSNDNGAVCEITVELTKGLHRKVMRAASVAEQTPEVFVRSLIAETLDGPVEHIAMASDFELVDALTRIGMALNQVAPIILETGHAPDEFAALLERLDLALDRVLPA